MLEASKQQNIATDKSMEEARRLSSKRSFPNQAGTSTSNPKAEEVKQVPAMVAVPSDDGFHICRQGGDTLDAFGPLTIRA